MTPPRIAVLTGAGVSAGSGVPTFRDAEGSLWRQHNPQDLATPEAFDRTPYWYGNSTTGDGRAWSIAC